METYDHNKIEKKWQKKWEDDGIYKTEDPSNSSGQETNKPKQYVLDMFPYPSGEGLHVGHPRGYIATDVYSRMKRMSGYNVLHPMGWDAFGLPAENFAIKNKVHPRIAMEKNVARFKEQLSLIGPDYDWSREINTTDPEFYKWTQWIFLQMYKKGLAYESFEPINWCPFDKTGLANEDVEADGTCERCGTKVEKRPMRQWVLKITDYADRLLADLDKLPKWPEGVKLAQRNWIGRSEGAEISFQIKYGLSLTLPKGKGIEPGYQTADPVNYKILQEKAVDMRNNPTHAEEILWNALKANKESYHFRQQHVVNSFIVDFICLQKQLVIEVDGDIHDLQKEKDEDRTSILNHLGFKVVRFRNDEVINNLDDVIKKIHNELEVLPFGEDLGGAVSVFTTRADTICSATFLAIAGEEDKFTGKYAINPANGEEIPIWKASYVLPDYGTGAIMGVPAYDERDRIFAEKNNIQIVERDFVDADEIIKKVNGKKVVKYKIKDWVFSRQRYWGEPIPIIHCEKCGIVPVEEKDLPVKLPEVENYEPSGTGESPLANIAEWVNTKCPNCGGDAKRETNTMPQWAGSSWYYLRYIDPRNSEILVDKNKEKDFMPVDVYVGGDHATRHLIYARFWHKFLFDIGAVSTEEPFPRLEFLGFILAEDGRKMSKRWGNIVNPDEMVARFGADAFRLYEMFIGPFDSTVPWNTDGMVGTRRFVERVWRVAEKLLVSPKHTDSALTKLLHKTIKKVNEDIENFKFNTAVSTMMVLVNEMEKSENVSKEDFMMFLQILAPFAPHMTEELWYEMGEKESIHLSDWPKYDPALIVDSEVKIMIQVSGKVRGEIVVPVDTDEEEVKKFAQADEKIKNWIEGKEIKNIIYVKNKLVNIVLV